MPGFLMLTEYFAPTRGGTPTWFSQVYGRLGGAGTQVVTAEVPGDRAFDAGAAARIHRLPLRRVPWLVPESLPIYLRLLARSLRLAATQRFDAIHAGRALPEGLVALLAGRLTRHAVLVYAHGEELTGWGRGHKYRAMRAVLRRADRVIANSANTRALLEAMDVPGERITVVHPGVDCARFRPGLPSADLRLAHGIPAGSPLVLSVGRLQARKGFMAVLESLPGLLRRRLDVHYVLLGSGEQEAALRARATRLGLADRFHLLSGVDDETLPRWYNACDVFAMPNVDLGGDIEGFGIVYLEAAACGKPALAGLAGGTGAAVVAGQTGLRVDATQAALVEAALARLLLDPALAARLGQQARARAVAAFDWHAVAARTAAL